MSRGHDLDIWQMSTSRNTTNQSTSYRRRVEFDVNEGNEDTTRKLDLTNNTINDQSFSSDSADSEPVLKVANAITSTVNLLAEHLITHPFIVIRRQSQVIILSLLIQLTTDSTEKVLN